MKTYISSKQVTKALSLLTFISGVLFSQSGFALEFTSKNGKSMYNVEVNKEDGAYNVTVKSLKDGKSETIYESSSINLVTQDGHAEYKDARLRLLDRKDGTATLTLNNGQNIHIELSE